ncbi:MAG: class II fructose-bisphosphate aldolase [Lachnospira pectinoschiza]
MIKKAISLGVAKINVNTECQLAFAAATRKYIEEGKDLEGKDLTQRKLLALVVKLLKRLFAKRLTYSVQLERHN